MEATYRGLGFDPTPGEVGSVSQAITQLIEAANALAELPQALRRADDLSQDWHGEAADAFRARLRDIPAGREDVLRRAAQVLDRWANVLTANKRTAEELDQRALRLRGRLDTARDLLQDKQNARDLAATPVAAAGAEADLASVTTLIADLESALEDVLDKARTLARDHQRAADAAADELAAVRGEDVPRPALPTQLRPLLDRGTHTARVLSGLLAPAGPRTTTPMPPTPPAGAAGALAAALGATER